MHRLIQKCLLVVIPIMMTTLLTVQTAVGASAIGTIYGHTSDSLSSVNNWWIDAGDGFVIVDAQRTIDEATEVVNAIRKTGRPVLGVLVTHSHSDHIGGLTTFRNAFGEDLPIYATPTTVEMLEDDPTGDLQATKKYSGAQFPDEVAIPDRMLSDGETIRFGSLDVEVTVFGAGEDRSHAVFSVPAANALFVGDIAANKRTPYLIDAKTGPWLAQIAALKTEFSSDTVVYPGHGKIGTMGMLDETVEYIALVREMVTDSEDSEEMLSNQAITEITTTLNERYPPNASGWAPVAQLDNLGILNVKAVAHELGLLPGNAPTIGEIVAKLSDTD